MKISLPVIIATACCIGIGTGWLLRGHVDAQKCSYLATGYDVFSGAYNRLPTYPNDRIPDAVIANIQQCWAARPFFGPNHPIQMIDARRVSATRYYLAYEPSGITDVNLLFLVDEHDGVIQAQQRSTQ